MVDPQVDPERDRRTFPRSAGGHFHRCRWSGRYVGRALFSLLVLTGTSSGIALAEGEERARAEIHVLGRLDTRPRVRRDAEQTTLLGVLSDEAGVPVAGTVQVLEPAPTAWTSCLAGAQTGRAADVHVDASGRFCLQGPALPPNTRARLRLSSPNYQTRNIEIPLEAKRGQRPRITAAPELVELDGDAEVVVEATTESGPRTSGDLADGELAELYVDCGGVRTRLAETRAEGGLFRFTSSPKDLPGPESCAFIVRSSADSAPKPVVLQARARLSSSGWSEQDGRVRAVIRADLRWQGQTKPLTVGVLEGHSGQKHHFTVPLSDAGEGVLEVDTPPTETLSLRLVQAPPYARPADALALPAPTAWKGWQALEVAGLLGLAAFLVLSWLGGESRGLKDPDGTRPSRTRLPVFGKRTRVAGRAEDAHTSRPIAASIELLAVGTTAKELLESTESDVAGHFSFQVREPGLTRLRLTAEGYVAFEGPLPPGEPVIRLTERRRAALALLTSWVRARSPTAPIPTPAEVHRQAEASGHPTVAQWAQDLAIAAYGRAPPTDGDLSALAERKPS